MNYLLKLHKSDVRLSQNVFQKLQDKGLDSIISSVAALRGNKKTCGDIVNECKAANRDVNLHFKDMMSHMLEMRLTQDEIVKTFKTIRDLDFCDPNSFALIYSFKKLDMED